MVLLLLFPFFSLTNKTTEMGIVTNAKNRKVLFFVNIQSKKEIYRTKEVCPKRQQ